MNTKDHRRKFGILAIFVLLMLACALPGLIPLTPQPKMEKDTEAVLEVLQGDDWRPLRSLAEEQYTQDDFAKPGVLDFTVRIADNIPTYFSYGWCTKDAETLRQNIEHIEVGLYLNGDKLGSDVVHDLSFSLTDGQQCLDSGVLILEWPAGEYQLKAIATFDEQINDGFSDYAAGDYVFEYNVTVDEAGSREGVFKTYVIR